MSPLPHEAQAPAPVVPIESVSRHENKGVTIRGWLYNLRESGKLLFPIFRDGTGIIQGVISQKEHPEAFERGKGLTQESSVIVTGLVRSEPRAPGGYELQVSDIEIIQRVPESEPYPIQLKEHGVDFLLDRRHLWIRTPRQAAILRIRAQAIRAARDFMDSQGYILTDAGGLRRHDDAFRSELYRRSESLPDAVRAALHGSDGCGTRQGLLFRSDVSR